MKRTFALLLVLLLVLLAAAAQAGQLRVDFYDMGKADAMLITTPDGVTLIPISKVSFGFGSGGGDYGKAPKENFGGGAGGAVKIDPVAFLVIKDGSTRVLPVAVPPVSTMDRIVDMVPDVMDKVEKFFDKKEAKETL